MIEFQCWTYDIQANEWTLISTRGGESFLYFVGPRAVYQEKIYFVDLANSLVFDTTSKTWSIWPTPPLQAEGGCMVQWEDNFILFGGYFGTPRAVQKFNHLTQTWEVLSSNSAPFDILLSNCIVLPNNEILVVAFKEVALYNPDSNTWKVLNSRPHVKFATLSGRVFDLVAPGYGFDYDVEPLLTSDTQEFDYRANTWTTIDVQLLGPDNGFRSAIALPARLFDHLPGGCVGI